MHYQWGRKDPFTPATTNYTEVQIYKADGTAITKGTNGIGTSDEQFKLDNTIITTINHLIQNPSTHYDKGDGTNRVPIASTTDLTKDWWNPTIKTIYDPCPNGYRIPKEGTYDGFPKPPVWSTDLTNGMTWQRDKATFFPTSGYRHASSGTFAAVGKDGFYWMAPPRISLDGYNLTFRSNETHPRVAHSRSFGLSVRCIKE